ncbi:MAG: glycosyltransferase [Altibacter sp.]|nr:glycosyltransferase [Altibacter sp.]
MVLFYVFAAVALINCCYFLLFSKFSFLHPSEGSSQGNAPVSLLICAKNEIENLRKNIPLWQKQSYPNYEIILINDASFDDTLEVMEQFSEQDTRIKIVNVENNETFWASKKYALTLGIKRAKHQRMVFTDADCSPAGDEWLGEMASHFSTDKQLVLGYGAYEKRKGFLNKIIRFETMLTALQYFSYAKAGMPYMGVGRNLAYTSDLYYANNGFISHVKIPSGDDDLFVNEVATGANTAICFAQKAFTYSAPKNTWKEWMHQKRRHVTTASYYKPQHKFLLALFYISGFLFWPLAILALLVSWKLTLPFIIARMGLQYLVFGKAATKLKESDLIPILPLLDLFLVFLQLSIFISNSNSKPKRWK